MNESNTETFIIGSDRTFGDRCRDCIIFFIVLSMVIGVPTLCFIATGGQ